MRNNIIICILLCVCFCSCNHTEPEIPIAYPTDSIAIEADEMIMQDGISLKVVVIYNTTDNVTWTSGNETIATVSDEGIITANKVGHVTIYASCYEFNGATDSVSVNIIPIEEKEYVPQVLMDWGASSTQINQFLTNTYSNDNIKKEDGHYACSNSNSITFYSILTGSDNEMLTNAVMYLWGKPDSIKHILKEKYTLTSESNNTLIYTDKDSKSIITCEYVSAGQIKFHSYLYNEGTKSDYFIISYRSDLDEIFEGKLSTTQINGEEKICIASKDGEIMVLSNFAEGSTYPIAFRDNTFNMNDEVIAIGYYNQNINNLLQMTIVGMIHK